MNREENTRDKLSFFFLAEDTIEKLHLYLTDLTGCEVTKDVMEVYIKESFLDDLLMELGEFYLIKETEDLCSEHCDKNCGECEKLEEISKKYQKSSS